MEVNLTNISINQPPAGLFKDENNKSEVHPVEDKHVEQQKTRKAPEKVMMDLKDVQSFLYIMIGSEIKIENDSNHLGISLNKTA